MKKNIVLIFATAVLTLSPLAFAYAAATISINPGIPGMQNVSTAGPCGWIFSFYTFAMIIAGILAFGAIVYGGVKYATSAGNSSKQSEGRGWIWSALLGLFLLGAAYLILHTINPTLIQCSLPGLSGGVATNSQIGPSSSGASANVTAVTATPKKTSSSSSGSGNPGCVAPANGPCSLSQIQNTCLAGNAQQAAGICNRESGGNPGIGGDKLPDGNYASWGLYQINISSAHITNAAGQTLNCPSAFTGQFTASNKNVTVKTDPASQALYKQCVAAMTNPSTNIANTCADSSNGTNWHYWATSGSGCTINGG